MLFKLDPDPHEKKSTGSGSIIHECGSIVLVRAVDPRTSGDVLSVLKLSFGTGGKNFQIKTEKMQGNG